jgi:hypothetical protein
MQISFYWSGSLLTPHALLSLKSFLAHGHECLLYTDDDIKNTPSGVTLREASSIIKFSDDFVVQKGFGKNSPAPFADLFRFNLLKQGGGTWSDLDVICLKSWSDLPQRFIASSLETPEGDLPNINVLGLKKNDPFASLWIDIFTTHRDPGDYAYGVVAAKRAFDECVDKPFIAPSFWFNPVSYRNASCLISMPLLSLKKLKNLLRPGEPLNIPLPMQSYGLHLWSQMWTSNDWSQHKRYSPLTLYGQLQDRYL